MQARMGEVGKAPTDLEPDTKRQQGGGRGWIIQALN